MITQNGNRDHAIVLGGSIAGLFAARVLSDYFKRVTIVERDPVHDEPESRKGQPQTRHLHVILEPARQFIRTHLPAVEQNLIEGGALVRDFGEGLSWYHFGGYRVQERMNMDAMALSRPFLEWQVRRGVTALPNVTLLAETVADELLTNTDHSRVTGVRITRRAGGTGSAPTESLTADLIIDASGRGSIAPKWLTQLGYEAPAEQEVKIRFGYATRVYRRTGSDDEARTYAISPTPPARHGAFMAPIEGARWIVTAGGYLGDHPPTEDAAFLDFLCKLPVPDIYEIIAKAEPLSDIVSYSYPTSRRRHYEKLRRFPDGFLVLGDAFASFNPIYGQGMSSAAMQVEALAQTLGAGNLDDAWRSFFRRTAKIVDRPWQLAVGEDFRYPETEGKRPIGTNAINGYVARVHRATHHDAVVYGQFLKVMHLLEPATSLMQPQMVWRVLRASARG